MPKKISQKSLIYKVNRLIQEEGMVKAGDRVLVAVSGGPDSVCLFDILDQLKNQLNIKLAIAHYNHRQRGEESDQDEEFVINLAKDRGVKYFIGRNKSNKKLSEDEARKLRYVFLEKSLGEWSGDKLVLAHNQNDQAETLLLNLIRGAGILGLSSIPLRRKKIIRPLLPFSRSEVLEHLLTQKIDYRHDTSNDSPDFSRNVIRKKVIPELEKLNHQATKNMTQAILILGQEASLLFELLENERQTVLISQNKNQISLDAKKMSSLSPGLILAIVRSAIINLKLNKNVSSKHYFAIALLIKNSIGNKKICPHKNLLVTMNKGIIRIEKR